MGRTVLIVEDELLLREAAAMDFEDLGFAPLLARDGAEALQLLAEHAQIDLLLTDIRMPGDLDGWELARRARALRPRIKVIYATGSHDDSAELVDGAEVLSKPFQLADITAALERIGLGS